MKNPGKSIFTLFRWALLVFIFAQACTPSETKPERANPAFAKYVASFTGGVVYRDAAISLQLDPNIDLAAFEENQEMSSKLISFSPAIEGKLFNRRYNRLEFVPEDKLPANTVFKAEFELGDLADLDKDYDTFSWQFETQKPNIKATIDNLTASSSSNFALQKLTGNVTSTDFVEPERLEKSVTVKLDDKTIVPNWNHSENGRTHFFSADSLQRGDNDKTIVVEYFGKNIEANGEGKIEREMPGLDNFKIVNTKIVQTPEQYILLQFSDPLDAKQNIEGLLSLEKAKNVRLVINSNEVRIYPETRVTGERMLTCSAGIKNALGYKLKKEEKVQVWFTETKPDVRLVTEKGTILPSTEGLIFPFEAVSLRAVDVEITRIFANNMHSFFQWNNWQGQSQINRTGRVVRKKTVYLDADKTKYLGEWQRHYLDLGDLIATEPGAIYQIGLTFRKEHSTYTCESCEWDTEMPVVDFDESDEGGTNIDYNYDDYYYDDYYYDDYYYDDYGYDYKKRDNPCTNSYFIDHRYAKKQNIFASDMGIIAKTDAENTMLATVTDLKTTAPRAGVDIEVVDFQNQPIGKGTTDANGMLKVKLKNGEPFLLTAKQNNEFGYLKMSSNEALQMSKFDISGKRIKNGLKGYLYGERGVWRPGDTLHLTLALQDANNNLPEKLPVVLEISDPRGKVVQRFTENQNSDGFYAFTVKTDEDAPTGNWSARAKVGGNTFYQQLKIETIKPNRLKIKLDFGEDNILSGTKAQTGTLSAKWLHGADAGSLDAIIEGNFQQANTTFEGYSQFEFDDYSKQFSNYNYNVFEGTLGADGTASIKTKKGLGNNAPGMLRANLTTRVYEKGGNFSEDRYAIAYSPYEEYVGINLGEADTRWGMYLTDKDHRLDMVVVDEIGKPQSNSAVKLSIYKINWRWWWNNYGSTRNYRSSKSYTLVSEQDLATDGSGKAVSNFKFSDSDWGRYLIVAENKNSGHSASRTVYVDGSSWSRRQTRTGEGASMLTLVADKDNYNTGEMCKLTFPSSSVGRALVTFESGSKILESKWIETTEGTTDYSFALNGEFAPNIYAHVAYIQPHAQTANDRPIRMYGVIPILVEDPETRLVPEIKMPDEIRPESSYNLEVSEKTGKEMTYTVAVVDEGLLDLTRYKTPNPWNEFYAREALGVKTWDMYKDVIGAHGIQFESLLALGGDGAADESGKQRANRFKPVVSFLGPFKLKKGETAKHVLQMENYVGSVRAMVVAGDGKAYGKADKAVPVRKPLMVLATLPRVVGPGEKVTLPVTIFAMKENIKDVSIKIEPNKFFDAEKLTDNISFSKIGDQVVNFDLGVAERLGIGTVKITVKSGKETATTYVELDVRNPNAPRTESYGDALEKSDAWSYNFDLVGMEGTNNLKLEISAIPALNLEERLSYLLGYPYGCVEQTTSKAFGQLFLGNLMELSADQKETLNDNIVAALSKLSNFQNNSGGLSYWPGASDVSFWGTNYAGHFMLEAEKLGYSLPYGMKNNWVKYQSARATNWSPEHYDNRWRVRNQYLLQAYRLYTLAMSGNAEVGAMNRLKEQPNLPEIAKWHLAGAYWLLGQENVAKTIISGLSRKVDEYVELSYTYGSNWRDQAIFLEMLTLMGEREIAAPVLRDLAEQIGGTRWYSTQTLAYSLMAISKFQGQDSGKEIRFAYTLNGQKSATLTTNKTVFSETLDASQLTGNDILVQNESDNLLFVRLISAGQPATAQEKAGSSQLGISVKYKNMNGTNIDVTKLTQGTDFKAEVTISHPGIRRRYDELALAQIFPSGWEIRNTRMDAGLRQYETGNADYVDFRDDRVYTFFDLSKGSKQKFTVLLSATYLGKYYLSGANCEAMYDASIYARNDGKWVEVVEK